MAELPPLVAELIRTFSNNGVRYLFHEPGNVADFVRWRRPDLAPSLDFAGMSVEPVSFVAPSFKQLESDLLLRLPFLGARSEGDALELYLLLEHQSEPDNFMTFRALEYLMAAYGRQVARWMRDHGNTKGLLLEPVLPVIFYTGTRTWDAPLPMSDLIKGGHLLGAAIPEVRAEFVSLSAAPPEELQGGSGALGWALWLLRNRSQPKGAFKRTLGRVVEAIDEGAGSRWEHLLWFARAMVYHGRKKGDGDEMAEVIRRHVRESRKEEADAMTQTMAEYLMEQGEAKGALRSKRETLLDLLHEKFKDQVTPPIEARINAEQAPERLKVWLRRVVTAGTIADMHFDAP